MSILSRPYFHDEVAAFAKLESIVWPEGPTCPHCGALDRINRLGVQTTKPSKPTSGELCNECKSKQAAGNCR